MKTALRLPAETILLAGGYYLLGRLCLLLAPAPEVVTPIWLPSGLALAWLWLRGSRPLMGVFIGSLLINLPYWDMTVSLAIATGSTLQIGFILYLMNRFARPTSGILPQQATEIGSYLAIAVLMPVLIATISLGILYLEGYLPRALAIQNWTVWWFGEAAGYLLLTPLLLVTAARDDRTHHNDWYLFLLSALLVGLGLLGELLVVHQHRLAAEENYRDQTAEALNGIKSAERAARLTVASIVSFFDASEFVSRQEFHLFCRELLQQNPWIQALEWVPRVSSDNKERWEQAAINEGYPNFQIYEKQEGTAIPVAPRDTYFPVFYIEPHQGNSTALGFDLGSQQVRLQALQDAWVSGKPIATAPIRLVQDQGNQPAFLLFVPVYQEGPAQDILETQRDSLKGFAVGVIRIEEMLRGVLDIHYRRGLDFLLRDVTTPEEEQTLAWLPWDLTSPVPQIATVKNGFTQSYHLSIAGRDWLLQVHPTSEYLASMNSPPSRGVPVTLSLLLAGLVVFYARLRQTVESVLMKEKSSLEERIRKRTAELIEINTALTKASQAKSAFLAGMSHEIRTPLTAIIGFAESLLEEDQPPLQRDDAIHTVIRNGHHLRALVDDILDLSKIEAEQVTVEHIPTDLFTLLRDLDDLIRPLARDKGLGFLITPILPLPATLCTDPTRLRQILVNLLNNAVKFTERGNIRLLVSVDSTQHQAVFTVFDSGIGVTADQEAHLFQPFTQADRATTRRYGGTGLGLHISQRLASRLGGQVTLVSSPGTGSVFTLVVNAVIPEEEHWVVDLATLTPDRLPLPARRSSVQGVVLLAEDNPDNQRLISLYLRRAGATVFVTEDGQGAVEQALASDVDLVLMDIQMPVMDGLAATELLRATGFSRPIVALTASATTEDQTRCLAAGCDAFLTKPVDWQQLHQVLTTYLTETSTTASTATDLANDPEYQTLQRCFLQDLPDRQQEIQVAAGDSNWQEVRRLAHRLKGVAGGFGQRQLSVVAGKLEQQANQGAPPRSLLLELDDICRQITKQSGSPAEKINEIDDHSIKTSRFRDRLEIVLAAGKLGIWEYNPATKRVYWNPALIELFNLSAESVRYLDDWLALVHKEDRGRLEQGITAALDRNSSHCEIIYRFQRGDGSWHWVSSRGQVVEWDEYGEPHLMMGVTVDISSYHRQEELVTLQNQFSRLLHQGPDQETLYNAILDTALHMEGLTAGGLYLRRPDGSCILVQHRGLSPAFVERVGELTANSPQAALVAQGHIVTSGYHLSAQQQNLELIQSPPLVAEGIKTLVVLPIQIDGQPVACLNLASHYAYELDETLLTGLETLAHQFGQGLRHLEDVRENTYQRENLKGLFDAMEDYLFVLDRDGQVVHCNQAASRDLTVGYGDTLVGQSVLQIHPPEYRFEVSHFIAEVLAERAHTAILPLQRKDGRQVMVDTRLVQGRWNGELALFKVARDITPLHQALYTLGERVKEQRCLYDVFTLTENVDQPVGEVLQAVVERLPGGWQWPELAEVRLELDGQVYTSPGFQDTPWCQEVALRPDKTQSGSLRLCYQHSPPSDGLVFLPEEANLLEAVAARLTALIQQHRSRRALQVREAVFVTIVEQAPDAIALLDTETLRFVEFNTAACRDLGYDHEEFSQVTLTDIHGILNQEQITNTVGALFDRGGGDFESRHRHKDGSLIDVSVRARSLVINDRCYLAATWRDISAQKQAEAALAAAKTAAESANQLKSAFLANVSHEIRTPLTAILGFTETLLEPGQLPERQWPTVRTILDNGRHLYALVNDLLDLSKIEAGRLDLEIMDVDLRVFLEDCLNTLQPLARAKGLGLSIYPVPPLPRTVHSDPTRLRQILINLLSNAVKFTAQGSVNLLASCDIPGETLTLSVQDSGIGLTLDQQNRLFQPFVQGDTSVTRRFGGTGLGLYLSRQLAERLGGELRMESTPGVGSLFVVTLPTGPLSASDLIRDFSTQEVRQNIPLALPSPPQLRGRVLVAEDNPYNQQLLAHHLLKTGVDVVLTANGEEAVAHAMEEEYQLILMDMQMPIMGGLEAAQLLSNALCPAPIIALTAHSTAAHRREAELAGCSGFLTKPVDWATFYQMLAHYLPAASQSQSAPPPPAGDTAVEELAERFRASLPETLTTLHQALVAGDLTRVAELAHQIKGVAKGFGHVALGTTAAVLETAARAGEALPSATALAVLSQQVEGLTEPPL